MNMFGRRKAGTPQSLSAAADAAEARADDYRRKCNYGAAEVCEKHAAKLRKRIR